MAKRRGPSNRLNYKFYTDLIAAFRETPGRFYPAARLVGCDPATAKRAWERGWLDYEPWAKPIKDVVEAEIRAARVRLQEEHTAAVDKVAGDTAKHTAEDTIQAVAIKERALAEKAKNLAQLAADAAGSIAEEAKMIRAYRTDLHGVAAMANHLLGGMEPVVQRVREALRADLTMKPGEAIGLLRQLTNVLKEGAEAAQKTMEMERLLLGQPQHILEAKVETTSDPVDSLAKIGQAFETLQRLGMAPPTIDVTPHSEPVDAVYSEENETTAERDAERELAPVLQLPAAQAPSNEAEQAP